MFIIGGSYFRKEICKYSRINEILQGNSFTDPAMVSSVFKKETIGCEYVETTPKSLCNHYFQVRKLKL